MRNYNQTDTSSTCLLLTAVFLALSALILQGCATTGLLRSGGPEGDNNSDYSERTAVLYYLNKGLRAHYDGDFEQSNLSFGEAEAKIEELYTKSISDEAASLMINDYTVAYRGEDFENVMINLFMALNYVFLRKWDDALVEARKLDNKLNVINARYEPDEKNVYKEDAFVRFIMGLLYESQNEMNEAFISYRKALRTYNTYQSLYEVSPPNALLAKLVSAASAMQFVDELNHYRSKYPHIDPSTPSASRQNGEVYFLHYNGPCPHKVENALVTILPDKYVLKVAVPKFERRPYSIKKCEIVLRITPGNKTYRTYTEVGEDIGAIAIKNLENRITRITAKAIARATAKYLAAKGARKAAEDKAGERAGLIAQTLTNIGLMAVEKADLRFWGLLPDRIDVGYLQIPSGTYAVTVNTQGKNRNVISRIDLPDIHVNAGEKTFVSFKTTR